MSRGHCAARALCRTASQTTEKSRQTKSPMRLVLKKLLLLLIPSLLCFLGAEVVLLVFHEQFFGQSFYIFDPNLGFRVRPYATYGNAQANEFGFNDRDYPHQRPPEVYRILILSDSFNWMGSPEGNYTALLEGLFEAEFGPGRVEVIAAGYSQTHTAEQLALLRKFGLRYNPDLVVLGFYAGNDFFDAHPQRKRIVLGAATTDIYLDRDFYTTFLGRPVVWQSRLWLFLRQKWIEYRYFGPTPNRAAPNQASPNGALLDQAFPNRASPNRPSLNGVATHRRPAPRPQQPNSYPQPRTFSSAASSPPSLPAPVFYPRPLTVPDHSSGISLPAEVYLENVAARFTFARRDRPPIFDAFERHIFDALRAMSRLLAAKHIDFLVAVYPDEVQVNPQLRRAMIERTSGSAPDYDWTRAQSLLDDFCARNSIVFLDLLPAFAQSHGDCPESS